MFGKQDRERFLGKIGQDLARLTKILFCKIGQDGTGLSKTPLNPTFVLMIQRSYLAFLNVLQFMKVLERFLATLSVLSCILKRSSTFLNVDVKGRLGMLKKRWTLRTHVGYKRDLFYISKS
jgi:hypothetical protein